MGTCLLEGLTTTCQQEHVPYESAQEPFDKQVPAASSSVGFGVYALDKEHVPYI